MVSQEDQEVSSATLREDYKENVARDPLDHMEEQQIEKLNSHMEVQQIEKLNSLMEEQQIEKFKRYEVECRRYLMSKYFSDKTIFGGDIFEVKKTEDGETTKMSRFPGYQSYADPANFKDDGAVETPLRSAHKKPRS